MAIQELLECSTSIFVLLRSIKILIDQKGEMANKTDKRYFEERKVISNYGYYQTKRKNDFRLLIT